MRSVFGAFSLSLCEGRRRQAGGTSTSGDPATPRACAALLNIMGKKLTAAELSALPVADFVAAIGGVYENSPWIAEKAYASGPYDSLAALAKGLKQVVQDAGTEAQIALLQAHPDLAGKAALAGELTAESTEEQASAGLGSLTKEEMATFVSNNDAYKAKFGFPFVLAVRNARKGTILGSFTTRLQNSPSAELAEGIFQVHKIAWMRLRTLVAPNPTGFLTCHVLDTARGCPAAGMSISLSKLNEATGGWELIGRFVTNSDGRPSDGPALKGEAFTFGTYEWMFNVGDYFATAGVPTAGTHFLFDVPLRFGIDDPEAHYHVPLLCSPWSFSTYRGS